MAQPWSQVLTYIHSNCVFWKVVRLFTWRTQDLNRPPVFTSKLTLNTLWRKKYDKMMSHHFIVFFSSCLSSLMTNIWSVFWSGVTAKKKNEPACWQVWQICMKIISWNWCNFLPKKLTCDNCTSPRKLKTHTKLNYVTRAKHYHKRTNGLWPIIWPTLQTARDLRRSISKEKEDHKQRKRRRAIPGFFL
jgi:hypothetical protein